jgi:hypothetical protein
MPTRSFRQSQACSWLHGRSQRGDEPQIPCRKEFLAIDAVCLSTRFPNLASNSKERGTQDECHGPPITMDYPYSRSVIEILRSTLSRLEKDSDFRQDDPAVVQLKRHILQSLAEFESQKGAHAILEPQPGIEPESPISVLRLR